MRLRSGMFAMSVSLATILSAAPGLMHVALADEYVTVPDAPVVVQQRDLNQPAPTPQTKTDVPAVEVPDAPVVIRAQDVGAASPSSSAPVHAAEPAPQAPAVAEAPLAAPSSAVKADPGQPVERSNAVPAPVTALPVQPTETKPATPVVTEMPAIAPKAASVEASMRLTAKPNLDPAVERADAPIAPALPVPTVEPRSPQPTAAPKAASVNVSAPSQEKPNLDPAVARPNVDPTPTASIPASAPAKSNVVTPADGPSLSNDALKIAAQTYASTELPHGPASEAVLRKARDEILAFYAARDYAPLWIANGAWSRAAQGAIDQLAHADDDGLNVGGYPVPSLRGASEADLAQAELRLSEAIVAYGQQAGGNRIDPAKLSALISAKPQVATVDEILAQVSAAANAGEALQSFNPPQSGYRQLRDKLAELRHEQAGKGGGDRTTIRIPLGPVLKIGMQDARVPLIRTRLGLDDTPATQKPEDLLYDTRVADAVADFQRSSGLPASGTLTPRTIAALSGGQPQKLEAELLANMERWRWVPRDMGDEHIEVNIPDFSVRVIDEGQVIHRTRAIVGKPQRQTPIFSNTMQFLIVNPSWNVPQSIIKKEMLPKLAEDPDYLVKHGYQVTQHGNTISVRQPPGERNALGHIKFMFPNDYSVYLHDTPTRNLFANDYRAYSHGCVRVDQPLSFASVVLGPQSGWTEERVKRLIGRGERTIPLPKPLPIHIMYFTTYVDENGKLIVRDDIYGHDRKVEAALGLAQ